MKSSAVKTILPLILAFLIALGFLAICSKNSFLYPMNDWVDVNCFMTMGRSILSGKTMYADIYEQKGPLLYFVYAVCALISHTSFLGAFVIELICFTLFLYYTYRIASLFIEQYSIYIGIIVMIITAFSVSITRSFFHGGSVEEISLFMLSGSLFYILQAEKKGSPLSARHCYLIGSFAAVALWTKFTICGFYLGLCIFIAASHLSRAELRRKLLSEIVFFVLGSLTVSAPIILYFAFKNALGNLYNAYFFNNIFVYGTVENGSVQSSILSICVNLAKGIVGCARYNLSTAPFFIIIVVHYIRFFRRLKKEALLIICCVITLISSTFGGGKCLVYYPHVFNCFVPIGVSVLIQSLANFIKKRSSMRFAKIVFIPLTALLLVLSFFLSGNTYLMNYKKEDLPQYKFASIIHNTPDATLLNYGFLDGGFYFASDIIPSCKYFCRLNIDLPEMFEEQRSCIEQGMTDFVVTRNMRLEEIDFSRQSYHCVSESTFYYEGHWFTYYLYERDS
ncbi:MAG: hypothetical protein II747_08145 [Clostridia bacterium]|nr:hypothetical protein [Clostridia bacterium]